MKRSRTRYPRIKKGDRVINSQKYLFKDLDFNNYYGQEGIVEDVDMNNHEITVYYPYYNQAVTQSIKDFELV